MATQTKQGFVRITLDENLSRAIDLIQQEYPLLSTAEAVKLILSRGLKLKRPSLSSILSNLKQTNPVQKDLTEDEMFTEWEKFNQKI
ncbi:MAG: hypothetical protein WCK98_04540 [bacterium]